MRICVLTGAVHLHHDFLLSGASLVLHVTTLTLSLRLTLTLQPYPNSTNPNPTDHNHADPNPKLELLRQPITSFSVNISCM